MKKILLLVAVLISACFADDLIKAGEAYLKGDYKTAFKLSKKICDDGNIIGCYNLGFSYDNAKGVEQDYKKAAKYYKKACDQGYPFACTALASLYHLARGVKKDIPTAREYYKRGCDLGDKAGCYYYQKF